MKYIMLLSMLIAACTTEIIQLSNLKLGNQYIMLPSGLVAVYK
jgi:hypothetical protein